MDQKELDKLLQKYINGLCSIEEKKLVEDLYQRYLDQEYDEPDLTGVKERIFSQLPNNETQVKPLVLSWLWKAASIIAIIGVGLYFYLHSPSADPNNLRVIVPGGNSALIQLANGKSVDLNKIRIGDSVVSSAMVIVRSEDGTVQYKAIESKNSAAEKWNTAIAPRGGQYCLVLADGSKVWLNSDSRLKFPNMFPEGERSVEIVGEAYFEIAPNKQHPFYVKSKGQLIKVVGTHFNVSAYPEDKNTYTTLLEGKIILKPESAESVVMAPGEQAVFSGSSILVNQVEAVDYASWKDGFIRFNDENIKDVMAKLERWYSIEEVNYIGDVSNEVFTGKFNRKKNIDQILKSLEKTGGVHFKVEGRRVIVMP
ncbi:MAG TPA: hypothetical protein DCS36_14440 [Sphingobacterium sp.]|nr:hypothetical protein [Sphingobacterium sp.]